MADNQIREPIIVRIPSLNYIDRKSSIILTVRQQPTFFHFLTVFLPLSFFFFLFVLPFSYYVFYWCEWPWSWHLELIRYQLKIEKETSRMAHVPKFTLLSHNKIILIFEHHVLSESRSDRTLSPVKICMHQENVQAFHFWILKFKLIYILIIFCNY